MKQSKFIISSPSAATDLCEEVAQDGADLGQDAELRAWSVATELHGKRLDQALAHAVPEFSRNYLQQLIESGAVHLNGQVVLKCAAKVRAGEQGVIELRPTPQSQAFKPEPMPLDIVFSDAHLLVIHKPAGLVVHPAPGNWSGTLLNGLLAHDELARLLPRAGIVHRLDKDTSGLMVVARTRTVMDRLVEMIAARHVTRQYLALAHRPWAGARSRHVEAPIGRDPRNRLRMAVIDLAHQAGKPASTGLELLENAEQGCWVRCTLGTGRTHQIRVHMASIGHPLVGDTLYGGASVAGMQRQSLHAFHLAFDHPVTQERLEFHAPIPQDMQDALDGWGLRYNPKS